MLIKIGNRHYLLLRCLFPLFKVESRKDALCQVWLKLAQWFCEEKFQISSMHFLPNSLSYPFGKGHDPSFEQTNESPSPQDALCQVWLKLPKGFWRIR